MRGVVIVMLVVVATGCFRWAPTNVAALSEHPGQRIRVTSPEVQIEIENTRVEQGQIIGVPHDHRVQRGRGISLRPPDTLIADPTQVTLATRKLSWWAIIGTATGALAVTTALAFLGIWLAAKLGPGPG